jgi:myosin heavy subunit
LAESLRLTEEKVASLVAQVAQSAEQARQLDFLQMEKQSLQNEIRGLQSASGESQQLVEILQNQRLEMQRLQHELAEARRREAAAEELWETMRQREQQLLDKAKILEEQQTQTNSNLGREFSSKLERLEIDLQQQLRERAALETQLREASENLVEWQNYGQQLAADRERLIQAGSSTGIEPAHHDQMMAQQAQTIHQLQQSVLLLQSQLQAASQARVEPEAPAKPVPVVSSPAKTPVRPRPTREQSSGESALNLPGFWKSSSHEDDDSDDFKLSLPGL